MPVANKEEELFAAYSVKNTRRANNARLFFCVRYNLLRSWTQVFTVINPINPSPLAGAVMSGGDTEPVTQAQKKPPFCKGRLVTRFAPVI